MAEPLRCTPWHEVVERLVRGHHHIGPKTVNDITPLPSVARGWAEAARETVQGAADLAAGVVDCGFAHEGLRPVAHFGETSGWVSLHLKGVEVPTPARAFTFDAASQGAAILATGTAMVFGGVQIHTLLVAACQV